MTLTAATTSARQASSAIGVIPTGAALGAEIPGIDLRTIDDAAFERLMDAWHEHSVVLLRGQSLNDQELIAFSRRLGDLDWAPIQETGRRFVEGLPEIYIVSNVEGERRADRQPRRRRGGVAHRHVVSRRAAEGEHALLAGDSADRRQHLVLQHVRDRTRRCRRR